MAVLFFLPAVILVGRATRIRVAVDCARAEVLVVNPLRTLRIPIADIRAVVVRAENSMTMGVYLRFASGFAQKVEALSRTSFNEFRWRPSPNEVRALGVLAQELAAVLGLES